MSSDAIAVLHPRNPDVLRQYLDLDEESEESEGLYAEALPDGTMLVHTFQEFALFADDPEAGREWMAQFGDDLLDVHDDPRGVVFFPDSIEPEGQTYDAVVAEVIGDGAWVQVPELAGEDEARGEDEDDEEYEDEDDDALAQGAGGVFGAAGAAFPQGMQRNMADMDLKDVAEMAQKLLSGLDFSALMAAEDPQQALTAMQAKMRAQFEQFAREQGAAADDEGDDDEGDDEGDDAEFPGDDDEGPKNDKAR
ncbi:hypothetical protein [Chondromyces apiculatus]|uniref:Uncharacterized protein n=1 Tax=Chondromyces apiculatus DSM 436 TaxID=1192034 RepID=A0A017T976_9BACT|nr:hypothetical protein [Chondromyces apiculatus]EYF05794.1 Hypothetical protein CAP_2795 [Chondromyces apiculatus DSM 436]